MSLAAAAPAAPLSPAGSPAYVPTGEVVRGLSLPGGFSPCLPATAPLFRSCAVGGSCTRRRTTEAPVLGALPPPRGGGSPSSGSTPDAPGARVT